MSDEPEEVVDDPDSEDAAPGSDDERVSIDDVDIRDALRAALKPPPSEPDSIIRGVQKKIREDEELDGQFFADGWSTAKAPKETYLVTSIVMLVVVIIIYLLIRPY